jgi:hypothetical protein
MTAAAIAHYLPEFDAADHKWAGLRPASPPASRMPALDAAFADGAASVKAAAEARLADKLAEQKALHERELAEARAAWARQEGERLAAQLVTGLEELEARLADTAARLLRPFVAAEVQRGLIADLAETLNGLLAREPAAAVSICGAADLLEALRARLAGKLEHVTFHAGPSSDIRVTAGQTLIETRLGAWMARIEEAAT